MIRKATIFLILCCWWMPGCSSSEDALSDLGSRTSKTKESAAPDEGIATKDPKAEFEKVLSAVKARVRQPVKYLHQIPRGRAGGIPAGGKWIRHEVTYNIRDFDVQTTDSSLTPLTAFIEVAMRDAVFVDLKSDFHGIGGNSTDIWFDTEAEAMQATKFEHQKVDQSIHEWRLREEFEWTDEGWTPKSGSSFFPFSDKLYELSGFEPQGNRTYIHEVRGIMKTYD